MKDAGVRSGRARKVLGKWCVLDIWNYVAKLTVLIRVFLELCSLRGYVQRNARDLIFVSLDGLSGRKVQRETSDKH